MAKTQWQNFSILIPLFMQKYFGTTDTEGHHHDNLDEDDSAPFIRPLLDIKPAEVFKDENLVNTLLLSTDVSYDNQVSFTDTVTWHVKRVGSHVTMKLIDEFSDPKVNDGNITLKLTAGGNFDTTYFGTTPFRSSTAFVTDGASGSVGYIFRDLGAAVTLITITNTDRANNGEWLNAATAGVRQGTCFVWDVT